MDRGRLTVKLSYSDQIELRLPDGSVVMIVLPEQKSTPTRLTIDAPRIVKIVRNKKPRKRIIT